MLKSQAGGVRCPESVINKQTSRHALFVPAAAQNPDHRTTTGSREAVAGAIGTIATSRRGQRGRLMIELLDTTTGIMPLQKMALT